MKIEPAAIASEIADLIRADSKTASSAFAPRPIQDPENNTFEVIAVNGQKFRIGVALIVEGEEG